MSVGPLCSHGSRWCASVHDVGIVQPWNSQVALRARNATRGAGVASRDDRPTSERFGWSTEDDRDEAGVAGDATRGFGRDRCSVIEVAGSVDAVDVV